MRNKRLVAIGFSALLVIWIIHFATNSLKPYGSIKGHTVANTAGPSPLVRSLRPSYPYSVIVGGAYSPGELRFANSKDTVVRDHYSDFDLKHAQLVRLVDDHFQYVSYRIKDQVYWTKKKLRIPSGELLLTDGVQYARARCGNRLSDTPRKAAASPHEPDAAVLSLPAVNMGLLPKLALAIPPDPHEIPSDPSTLPVTGITTGPLPNLTVSGEPLIPLAPVWGGQPITSPVFGQSVANTASSSTPTPTTSTPVTTTVDPGKTSTPPAVVAPVPEPSTIYLFLMTMLFSGWAFLRMRGKTNSK